MAPIRTRVKFCGMQTARDVALAADAGADAVGVVVAPSPRRVSLEDLPDLAAAIPPFVGRIGVVTGSNAREADRLTSLGFTIQFSGDEAAAHCEALARGRPYIKAFHVGAGGEGGDAAGAGDERGYVHATWMFDTRDDTRFGGTGIAFPWSAVEGVAKRRAVIVSGGLTPENVGACIRTIRPYAVDVRSGVETGDEKDFDKMCAFVRAVREADAQA